MERIDLAAGLTSCRLLNGLWQVSGAHGPIDAEAAVEAMLAYHDAGFTTWDLADHYGPAEDLVGEFRRRMVRRRGEGSATGIQAFTKWVPQPGPVTRYAVEHAVERSLRRMDVEALDLLQFHWWHYEDAGYLDALGYLSQLKEQGLIRHLAVTNFDTRHLRLIVERGIPIVANQVQYSLIDRRPAVEMAAYCQAHGIHLLTYGTLAGSLLTERYLEAPEPGRWSLDTASLQKYKQMVDAWGGWALFQELLGALSKLARARGTSIAGLALRYVLDRPAVGGIIVGARLGVAEHIQENAAVSDLSLEAEEWAEVEAVLSRGNDLYRIIGDCGDEYRR